MAIQNLGVISHVVIGTPSLTLAGVTNRTIDPNVQTLVEGSDGEVDPRFVAVMMQRPMISIDTTLLTALSSCGIAGASLTNFDTYFHQINPYGTRKTGANHEKLQCATGLMVPRTLVANQQSPAVLTFDAYATSSDGVAVPWAFTASQALPAGGGISAEWTVGPLAINGSAYAIESASVDFGLDVRAEIADGGVFPTFAYIQSRRPVIRCTTLDSLALSDLGISGTAQGVTDSTLYFRKMAATGRVANATAEHVKLTVDDGHVYVGPISNAQGERQGSEIVIEPVYDGTNAILVISTASAIT